MVVLFKVIQYLMFTTVYVCSRGISSNYIYALQYGHTVFSGFRRGSRNFRQGRSKFPKILTRKKKKKKKRKERKRNKNEGYGGSFPLAEVRFLNRLLQTLIYICFFFFGEAYFVQLQAPLYTNTQMTW